MADNYLENKMEEHRRRHTAPGMLRPHSRPSTLQPTIRIPDFSRLRLYVRNPADHPTGKQIIEAFRSVGAGVAYTAADNRKGLSLAQACGAKYIPADIKQPLEYYKDTNLIISLSKPFADRPSDIEEWIVCDRGLEEPELANYLLLKAASMPLFNPVAYLVSKS